MEIPLITQLYLQEDISVVQSGKFHPSVKTIPDISKDKRVISYNKADEVEVVSFVTGWNLLKIVLSILGEIIVDQMRYS